MRTLQSELAIKARAIHRIFFKREYLTPVMVSDLAPADLEAAVFVPGDFHYPSMLGKDDFAQHDPQVIPAGLLGEDGYTDLPSDTTWAMKDTVQPGPSMVG